MTQPRPAPHALSSEDLTAEITEIVAWFRDVYEAKATAARLQRLPGKTAAEEMVALARLAREQDTRQSALIDEVRRRDRLRFDAATPTAIRLLALELRAAFVTHAGPAWSGDGDLSRAWEELPDADARGWAAAARHALGPAARARRAVLTGGRDAL